MIVTAAARPLRICGLASRLRTSKPHHGSRICKSRTPAFASFPSNRLLRLSASSDLDGIDWVIVGGESGPGARPMKPEWAIDIRNQCVAARVAFFFKQWGGRSPKTGGRLLDGQEWNQFPTKRRAAQSSLNCGQAHDRRRTFKFDEIGDWSELKLEIVEQYGAAYTKASATRRA